MKLKKQTLREIAALLRAASDIKQPPGPVTRASVDREADKLVHAALLKRKKPGANNP